MSDIYNFLNKNFLINKNDYIVIGLSGGPDSMVLLNILLKYKYDNDLNYNIVCAHINHNLRKESEDEEKFIIKYCKDNNLLLERTKFEYDKKFTESVGHQMRYNYFEKIVKKYKAKYLFTAHHGDDLIETILMRIVRGSSLSGYAGFEKIIDLSDYKILRPLVYITKNDIISYVEENNIPYVVDKSNFDDKYTRNRFRKYILPRLKEEDENVHLKFLQYSDIVSDYSNYLKIEIDKIYDEMIENNCLILDKAKNVSNILLKEVIYKWLSLNYKSSICLINKNHIDNIIKMIYTEKPNIEINLPVKKLKKEYNKLYFGDNINIIEYKYKIVNNVLLHNNKIIRFVDKSCDTSNYSIYIDSSKVKLPLFVRNIKSGDKMTIKNFKGHKKIKDILINEKIPLSERNGYPVVVDSNDEIIWLPGIKKSSFDSQNTQKYDIILEYR